ncbi:hypothetical protein CKO28_12380 [Rhodovibrio sodomensis]|uniref:Acyloxyacyl hydrolase n=1 Tax=Rhodovibrio sodomensis TaxID=1088 RepID=A0ABS1DGH8_9PROT|nr:acyloxyacyl hydrolase [Rhodovibrio sodomensis]MBK1668828.1 hypothetical protein [Rhodovibrio sodomensis]
MTTIGGGARAAIAAACLAVGLIAGPAYAQNDGVRDHLDLSVGYFDVIDHDMQATEFGALYRPGVRYFEMDARPGDIWRGIGPQIGASINTDGGALGQVGLFLDIRPADNLVIWPGASLAAWEERDSRDLGGTFQFASQLYLGYRLPWEDLVGVSFRHVSNAGLHDSNPGADTLFLSYTVSFAPLFAD